MDASVEKNMPVLPATTNAAKRVAKAAEKFAFDTSAFVNLFDRSVLDNLSHAGREQMDMYTEPLSEDDATTLMENMRTLHKHTPVRCRVSVFT
jgi:hypothetical protein